MSRSHFAALGIAAVLTFATGGCGDENDESLDRAPGPQPASPVEQTPPAGEETEPAPAPAPAPEPEPEEPQPTAPGNNDGGVSPSDPRPEPGDGDGGPGGVGPGQADPSQPDSPDNDVAPEAGSPADEFEQSCRSHPGACG